MRALNDYLHLGYTIYFWRTQSQHEVDFVLYGEKGLLGFEIKRSSRVDNSDLKSLKLFAEDYPEAQLYLLYGGKEKLYFDSIQVIPFTEALEILPELLIPQSAT